MLTQSQGDRYVAFKNVVDRLDKYIAKHPSGMPPAEVAMVSLTLQVLSVTFIHAPAAYCDAASTSAELASTCCDVT